MNVFDELVSSPPTTSVVDGDRFHFTESVFNTRYGIAFVTAASCFVLAASIRPDFLYERPVDGLVEPRFSFLKTSVLSALCGSVVLLLPEAVRK